jgi:hypothetical protein
VQHILTVQTCPVRPFASIATRTITVSATPAAQHILTVQTRPVRLFASIAIPTTMANATNAI